MNEYGILNTSYEEMQKIFKQFPSLEKVILFGSRARGNYRKTSDIDLAIISREDISSRLLGKLEEIRCVLTFDVVMYSNIENKRLLENIRQEGIVIYEAK